MNTGVKCEIPLLFGLLLCGRSKLAADGFTVEGGVIDSDFRGEIKVILYNHTKVEKVIQQTDRIAQGWFLPVPQIKWIQTNDLTITE